MKKLNEKELEQLIHATLRSLPDRKAPGTLEARVLAALEHRATVAWYHRSWAYWPAAVRALFLAVATAVGGATVAAFYLLSQGVDVGTLAARAGERLSFFTKVYHLGVWTVDFVNNIVSTIPSLWLYGGIALVAALYATFFGLGAAAYRTLYATPDSSSS
jgi:hypothetical protein